MGLRFVPSRVEGLAEVTEVAVFPDRLDLCSAGKWLSFPFAEMAQCPRPAWLWCLLARLRWRQPFLPVGERDWFRPPTDRFFRFFTTRIVVYMPDEPAETSYGDAWFRRVQDVMDARWLHYLGFGVTCRRAIDYASSSRNSFRSASSSVCRPGSCVSSARALIGPCRN